MLLAATIVCFCSVNPAQGSAIQKFQAPTGQKPAFRAWANYLAAGPEVWSSTSSPPFTTNVRRAIWQILKNDTAAEALADPMINYLFWRQSLNVSRFNRYHPNLAPRLIGLLNSQELVVIPPPAVSLPVTAPATLLPEPAPLVPPSAQGIPAATIPEPPSVIVALGVVLWGLAWRARVRRQSC